MTKTTNKLVINNNNNNNNGLDDIKLRESLSLSHYRSEQFSTQPKDVDEIIRNRITTIIIARFISTYLHIFVSIFIFGRVQEKGLLCVIHLSFDFYIYIFSMCD